MAVSQPAGKGLQTRLSFDRSAFLSLCSPGLIALLLLLGGLILLCACGIRGNVPRTIKVGLSAPFEGLYRDLGYEVLYAVRLAVRERNGAGGIGDRYLVELVALNDFNEPDEAARQAKEMAADTGILAVLGGWSPATARAAGPEYQDLGLAFVAPAHGPGRLGSESARIATEVLQARRAAVLCGANSEDRELAAAFAEGFSAQGGAVVAVGLPSGAAWAEDLLSSTGSGPDLAFIAADAPTAAPWIVALRQAGFKGDILGGPALGSRLMVDLAGDASDGVVHVSYLPPGASSGSWLQEYAGLSGGALPGVQAAWAYEATHRILDGVEAAALGPGGLSRRSVWQALEGSLPEEPGVHVYVVRDAEVFAEFRD